jgi:CP family cyanate transporter-like MFS transporter
VRTDLLSLVSFLLLALNLRPAITAVGPLVGSIQDTTGLSGAAVGLLSGLPLLAFAGFAPLARFVRRIGLERTLAIAMSMLVVGILLRSSGSTTALFAGTVVLGAGIAVGNVLAPSIIKRDYPERVGSLTTVYALILALSAAIASGLSVPFENVLPGGWRSALALWAIPAAVAALLWARASLHPRQPPPQTDASAKASVWHSPLAWCVTGFMGLQSLCFYVVVAWIPLVVQDTGYDPAEGGLLLTGFQLVSVAAGAALPRFLAWRQDQRLLAALSSLSITTGILGLLWHPEWTIAWIVIMGFGSGVCFPLAIAYIGLRSRDHHEAASLSLMAQSMGYLLAAFGPFLFGLAHDLSGSWTLPLWGLAACTLLQSLMGYQGGRKGTVTVEAPVPPRGTFG